MGLTSVQNKGTTVTEGGRVSGTVVGDEIREMGEGHRGRGVL